MFINLIYRFVSRRGSVEVLYNVTVSNIMDEIAPEVARADVADAITAFVVENDESALEVEENAFDGQIKILGLSKILISMSYI